MSKEVGYRDDASLINDLYDDFMLNRQLKEKGTFTLDKSKNSPVLQRIP